MLVEANRPPPEVFAPPKRLGAAVAGCWVGLDAPPKRVEPVFAGWAVALEVPVFALFPKSEREGLLFCCCCPPKRPPDEGAAAAPGCGVPNNDGDGDCPAAGVDPAAPKRPPAPAGLLLPPRLPNSDDMVGVFAEVNGDGEDEGGGLVSSNANLTRSESPRLPLTRGISTTCGPLGVVDITLSGSISLSLSSPDVSTN